MPCSSIKDKPHWNQAKKQAAKEGQAGNYKYIQAIYQKMISGKKKGKVIKMEKKEKKEEPKKLAASEDVFSLSILAKAHNATKIDKLKKDLEKAKNKEEKDFIKFSLSILEDKE